MQRFLVTSGFRRLQETKVRALGFADWFAGIYIDALDEPNRRGKHGFFQDILSAHGLRPEAVLVVVTVGPAISARAGPYDSLAPEATILRPLHELRKALLALIWRQSPHLKSSARFRRIFLRRVLRHLLWHGRYPRTPPPSYP